MEMPDQEILEQMEPVRNENSFADSSVNLEN